jgi:hypothetical protein
MVTLACGTVAAAVKLLDMKVEHLLPSLPPLHLISTTRYQLPKPWPKVPTKALSPENKRELPNLDVTPAY